MKSNIKEEIETKYLKEDLVNDNTLLLYEQVSENDILVKMRYIEFNKLKEKNIAYLTNEEFIEGDKIQTNEDNTALVVFKKIKDEDVLITFYDLETHSSIRPDFIECLYDKKFNDKVDNYLKLKK